MKYWDHYQGDGQTGPFGYADGWFVQWALDAEGDLTFSLDLDTGPDGGGPVEPEDPVATEEGVREHVEDWLETKRAQEYSREVAMLEEKCREAKTA